MKLSDEQVWIDGTDIADLVGSDGRSSSDDRIPAGEIRQLIEKTGFRYPSRAQVVSFIMCKGGVGKTTSAYLSSRRLVSYGARILAIDADSQANLTASFHLRKRGIHFLSDSPVLSDLLFNGRTLDEAALTIFPELHLIPSKTSNAVIEQMLRNRSLGIQSVCELIRVARRDYEYILIDCAPSLTLLNASVVFASNVVVLPVMLDHFSQLGLHQTIEEINAIEQEFKIQIKKHVLITRFDIQDALARRYLSRLVDRYRGIASISKIEYSDEIEEAFATGKDFFNHATGSARKDYDDLAREILGFRFFFGKTAPTLNPPEPKMIYT